MPIRNIDRVPLRSNPSSFSEDMEWLLSNLAGWTVEVNETATEVAALAEQTNNAAISLAANTPSVLAIANFKGAWANLVGPFNIPSTVFHLGTYWTLAADVPDIAAVEPSVSSVWLPTVQSNHIFNFNSGII